MTTSWDLTDYELDWLDRISRFRGLQPPEETARRLTNSGLVDQTDLGMKITCHGIYILRGAKNNGR